MSIIAPNLVNLTSGELAKAQPPVEKSEKEEKPQNNSAIDKKWVTQKYCGLSNPAATCYMNSVLQALFMTPEFRKAVFKWRYNEKEHGKPEYCIPFQLQKLFAELQLKISSFANTKGLTRSFNWESGNAFQQQDIQEFYTVFCDAIDQTTKDSEIDGFLQDIFGGTIVNYIQCKEYNFESTRPENLIHLTMTVKNPFEKIYNDSLEKALQIYLKPEFLTGDNQYYLEEQKKKVDAVKGIKFVKLPKILGIIFNRFSFDYFTMKREKLDDFVSFPFVLNMNKYIEGYEGIQDKIQEVNEQYFKETPKTYQEIKKELEKGPRVIKSGIISEQKKTTVSTGTSTDDNAPPRSVVDEIKRLKRGKDVDVIVYSEELNEIVTVRESTAEDPKKQSDVENKQNGASQVNPQESSGNDADSESRRAHTTELDAIAPKKRVVYGLPEAHADVEDPPLLKEMNDLKNNPPRLEDVKKIAEATAIEEEKRLQEKIEKEKKYYEERTASIERYLKEGPLVYDLYAILVHMGGAYGGHYYAFIKSFEDGYWYRFDDSSVSRMDPEEIPTKAFGGGKAANAYKLLYRQVEKAEEVFEKVSDDCIPVDLRSAIEHEKIAEEIAEIERIEKMNKIEVRVHHKKEVKLISANLKETLEDLFEKALKEYNLLSFPRHNVRIRAYQPSSETMQDTYRGKEKKTLEDLKIFSQKNLILETKEEAEEFSDYDSDRIGFKIALWRNNLVSLEEKELRLRPIFATRKVLFGEFVIEVAKELGLEPEKIHICKKQYWKGQPTAEILSKEGNLGKTFVELKLFENMILYVEEIESQESACRWATEFEKDAYRCKIRFNDPRKEIVLDYGVDFDGVIVVDSRGTLQKLKEEIGRALSISVDEFIMKKGGKMGVEVKDLSKTVESENYVNGTSLFIEFGTPAKSGEFRLQFFYARKIVPEIDGFAHKFETLCDLSIDGEMKASGVKMLLVKELKEKLGIEADPRRLRLRERASERMTKIYKDVPMKSQHIIDKKQIAVEVLDYDDTAGNDDVLIIVRKWDSQTFELSPRVEFVVNKHIGLKLLAELILEKYPEITMENLIGVKILAPWTMNRYTLNFEIWSSLNEEKNIVGDHPFYFTNDGFLLVVKDKSQPVKELDLQQQKELGISISKNSAADFRRITGGVYNSEGQGVKIKIKTKEEQEKEEQERLLKALEEKNKPVQETPVIIENKKKEIEVEVERLNEDDLCPIGD